MNAGVATAELFRTTGTKDGTPSTEFARARLARWLLDGGAQLRTGANAGGVAGWLDGAGNAAYAYPEITGYYLQWLAWHATRDGATPDMNGRAVAAQRWLASWIVRGETPQTRVYLRAHESDWRNGALFFFDLAMIARGVASAARVGLIVPDAALVRSLGAQLSRLIDSDGMFVACASVDPVTPLPARWSTRRGGFLAKAAAGVLVAAEVLPALAWLRQPAQDTFLVCLAMAIEQPHNEAHPALYAIEGALSVPDRNAVEVMIPRFAEQLESLLLTTHGTGMLNESRSSTGTSRLDIVAQGLRVAALLDVAASDGSACAQALADMTQLLVRSTRATGALPFSPTATKPQYNTWCAMFAEQALGLVHARPGARTLAQLAALLV
jgi:hypothetical protein